MGLIWERDGIKKKKSDLGREDFNKRKSGTYYSRRPKSPLLNFPKRGTGARVTKGIELTFPKGGGGALRYWKGEGAGAKLGACAPSQGQISFIGEGATIRSKMMQSLFGEMGKPPSGKSNDRGDPRARVEGGGDCLTKSVPKASKIPPETSQKGGNGDGHPKNFVIHSGTGQIIGKKSFDLSAGAKPSMFQERGGACLGIGEVVPKIFPALEKFFSPGRAPK